MHLGDFPPAAFITLKFPTVVVSTGVPSTLSSATASIYKDDGNTETTTGVTLAADFDSTTGLNHVEIDTADAFYTAGSDFHLVVAGTVAAASVLLCPATFSIRNRVVKLADGVEHGGTTATLALARATLANSGSDPALDVTNSGGDAMRIKSTSDYAKSLNLSGPPGGWTLYILGADSVGASGGCIPIGIYAGGGDVDGGPSSPAISISGGQSRDSASPSSPGIEIDGGPGSNLQKGGPAVLLVGGWGLDSGSGGGPSGEAIIIRGGIDEGHGGADAIVVTASGSGVHGLNIAGGDTSGDAIHLTTTSGDDIHGQLAANALDLIHLIPPTGPAAAFIEGMTQLLYRYFPPAPDGEVVKDSGGHTIITKNSAGSTVTTQPYTDDGLGNETIGAAV